MTAPEEIREGLARLHALPPAEAEARFLDCCASPEWARGMAAARPFGSRWSLHAAARHLWWRLEHEEQARAFAAHPRIGERPQRTAGRHDRWSQGEQAGVGSADDDVQRALAEANRTYEERFGHVYLVCATGKSAGEMLDILHARLEHDAAEEWRVAAAEQAEITGLRLDKLLAELAG